MHLTAFANLPLSPSPCAGECRYRWCVSYVTLDLIRENDTPTHPHTHTHTHTPTRTHGHIQIFTWCKGMNNSIGDTFMSERPLVLILSLSVPHDLSVTHTHTHTLCIPLPSVTHEYVCVWLPEYEPLFGALARPSRSKTDQKTRAGARGAGEDQVWTPVPPPRIHAYKNSRATFREW